MLRIYFRLWYVTRVNQCFCYHSFFLKHFLFFKIYLFLFIFGCTGSLLLCVGFLQLQQVGATLHCGAWASHCGGFSCCGARALGAWASVVVARGLSSCGSRVLECMLSSCGTWAQLLCDMWDLPGQGLEPVASALAGGFSTATREAPLLLFLKVQLIVPKLNGSFADKGCNLNMPIPKK